METADGRSVTIPETPAATNVMLETVLRTEDIMPDGGIRIFRYSSDAWFVAIEVVREEGVGSSIQYLFNARGEKGERGEKGSTGAQGVAGINGIDGRDGKDGINGPTAFPLMKSQFSMVSMGLSQNGYLH